VPDRLLSYRAVAELLDCSTDTVKRLWRAGLIDAPKPYRKLGLRFKADDIYRYIHAEETLAREAEREGKKPKG
jgi:excisionase family DNA binding protein